MKDKVFIRDLRIDTVIGIYAWEKAVPQTIALDLVMAFDNRQAAGHDDIEHTLNYKAVAKRLVAFVGETRFDLVETLAERCAEMVLEEFEVDWLRLTVTKPRAVRHSQAVGVTIERGGDQASGQGDFRQVYVGLGSNVKPETHLAQAMVALVERFGPQQLSPVYRSPAAGFEGDDFLNAVSCFPTGMSLEEVAQALREIEDHLGRDRNQPKFSDRTMDLDLLLYGSLVSAAHSLPRKDILGYAFVLKPLVDLAPRLEHPHTGKPLHEHWAEFKGERGLEEVLVPGLR